MSTELSVLDRVQDPQAFVFGMGKYFAESAMFGCKTVSQGIVLAMHCMMERISPLEIVQTFHFIEGRLSMRADAMLGRAHAAGYRHRVVSRTPELAEVEMWPTLRDGSDPKHSDPVKFSLSWAEAQKEPFVRMKDGGLKTNWATPRTRMQMLWARVVSDAVRTMAPEVVCGAYTPEELGDEPEAIDAEVVAATAPAAQQEAPKRGTRKVKEEPAPAPAAAPVATTPEPAAQSAEPTPAPAAAVPAPAPEPVKEVATAPAAPAPAEQPALAPAAAPELPADVQEIIDMHAFVSANWPNDWTGTWEKVRSGLKFSATATLLESIAAADATTRKKLADWLAKQKATLEQRLASKGLNTWANQTPQTAATAAS